MSAILDQILVPALVGGLCFTCSPAFPVEEKLPLRERLLQPRALAKSAEAGQPR